MNMLPLFYSENTNQLYSSITLEEDTSKHIVQVLRMHIGQHLELTNGKGQVFDCEIINDHKKKVEVKIQRIRDEGQVGRRNIIGISLLKNVNRFEWFLEKATELGIAEIIPMLCERTERQHFRTDRIKSILISAMIQSKQYWLPVLHEPVSFAKLVESSSHEQKFIAHCIDENKNSLVELLTRNASSRLMLIGPEGDFTSQEIALATQQKFIAVSLGQTRLRTETAGVAAATLLMLGG
jgi:16S rRNA (uracil1498-N3)-methyltransferase